MMKYLDVAVLPYSVGEAEIVGFRRSLHFLTARAGVGAFCVA